MPIAGSSNGRTSPSGGEYLGSSPSPAANMDTVPTDLNGVVWVIICVHGGV